jgi:DNA-binding MarR family transcriptional regulator
VPNPAPPGGPTPDEPDLTSAVRALAFAARSLERAAGDLTLAQYRVLAFVAAGHERSSIVAEGLALAKPTVTATVDWLVERDMLTREAVTGDRRSVRLAVTRQGAAALKRAEKSMGERLEQVLEHAGDRQALLRALADLDDALAERMRLRLARAVRQ